MTFHVVSPCIRHSVIPNWGRNSVTFYLKLIGHLFQLASTCYKNHIHLLFLCIGYSQHNCIKIQYYTSIFWHLFHVTSNPQLSPSTSFLRIHILSLQKNQQINVFFIAYSSIISMNYSIFAAYILFKQVSYGQETQSY